MIMGAIKNRYEFVVLFDVENGNPTETRMRQICLAWIRKMGDGLVTDVCLKRKIRNYVETVKEGEPGYRIYVKDGVPLNQDAEAGYAYSVGKELEQIQIEKGESRLKKLERRLKRETRISTFFLEHLCALISMISVPLVLMTTFVKGALSWWPGSRPCSIRQLCPVSIHFAPGSDYYPRCHHHRGRCGEERD